MSFKEWLDNFDTNQEIESVKLCKCEKSFEKYTSPKTLKQIVVLANKPEGLKYRTSLIKTIVLDKKYPVKPLRGQKGVVAIADIPKRTAIAIFEGKYTKKIDDYTLCVNSDKKIKGDPRINKIKDFYYYIDPITENPCKYINDFRGHGGAMTNNVDFICFMNDKGYCMGVIVAIKDISEGENILIDYGEEYWTSREN